MDGSAWLKSIPLADAIGRCYVQTNEWGQARTGLFAIIDILVRRYGTMEQKLEDMPPEDPEKHDSWEEGLMAMVFSEDEHQLPHEWRMRFDHESWQYRARIPVDPSLLAPKHRNPNLARTDVRLEGKDIIYTKPWTYGRKAIEEALPILEINRGVDRSIGVLADNMYITATCLNTESRQLPKRRKELHGLAQGAGMLFSRLLEWERAPKDFDDYFNLLIRKGIIRRKPEVAFDQEKLAFRANIGMDTLRLYGLGDGSLPDDYGLCVEEGVMYHGSPSNRCGTLMLTISLADVESFRDADPSFGQLLENVYERSPYSRRSAAEWRKMVNRD